MEAHLDETTVAQMARDRVRSRDEGGEGTDARSVRRRAEPDRPGSRAPKVSKRPADVYAMPMVLPNLL
mgnify:CR=1 FL=1